MLDRYERDIRSERIAQIKAWGPQNHPSVDQALLTRPGGSTADRMAEEYEIPTAMRAKFMCELAAQRGQLTWAHIALEEFAEAIEAATIESPMELRNELTQLEAVIRAWRESVDRNHR